jgi:hypothetical protein
MVVSVCDLSQNRATNNLKVLWVQAVITSIRNRTPPSGHRYTIVQLKDAQGGSCWVRPFFWHDANFLQRGQTVTTLGRYFDHFRYGRWTFSHELQVTEFEMNGHQWILTGRG